MGDKQPTHGLLPNITATYFGQRVSALSEEEMHQYVCLKTRAEEAMQKLSESQKEDLWTKIRQKDIKGQGYITSEDLDSILEPLGLIDPKVDSLDLPSLLDIPTREEDPAVVIEGNYRVLDPTEDELELQVVIEELIYYLPIDGVIVIAAFLYEARHGVKV